jgi:hypothetical protein
VDMVAAMTAEGISQISLHSLIRTG